MVAIVAAAIALGTFAPATAAQVGDAIRVETRQIVVPVLVWDKDRARRFNEHRPEDIRRDFAALEAGDTKLLDALMDEPMVLGLTIADFHLFDDGKEQIIQNVSYESNLYWDVRDNRGHHTEYIGPGGGKWSGDEWKPGLIGDTANSHYYVIAYALPDSPKGSCHKIRVEVSRPNAVVYARGDYCNTRHSASDPLDGTKLGRQLDDSPQKDKVVISLAAIPLFPNSDAARVHIVLEWRGESLKGILRSRGVLGMVLKKDGTLVARFSDVARIYADKPQLSSLMDFESRYERQLLLAPGEYDLRVVLGDGTRFGHAKIPLTVNSYDKNELTISQVSLCKRVTDVAAYSSQNRSRLPGAWGQNLNGDYKPLVSRDVEFELTGNTRFKKRETLYTYFEIYEPLVEGQSSAAVQIQMRIFDSRTGEVISDSQPISAAPYMTAGSSIIPVGRGMDLSKLPIGSYRLDVQATDSTGKSAAWRSANFTVEK